VPCSTHVAFLEQFVRELGEALDRGGLARHGEAVADPAGGLDQRGACNVRLVQHHARREAHEAGAAIGLQHDHPRDAQLCVAQQQVVADLQAQRFEQRAIDPDFAGGRHRARGLTRRAGGCRDLQVAAQRIARRHRLQRHQLAGTALRIAGARHGRKAIGRSAHQAEFASPLDHARRRRVVAGQHRVAAEQLPRVALQAALEPVGKEPDGRERGHRQQHGHDQKAQFAGAQVTPQGAPAEAKGSVHVGTIADTAAARVT
jgi:hypothetical protein